MAGSPGLPFLRADWGSSGRLYSGGDERCARGRSAHQRGLANPKGEVDEGRGTCVKQVPSLTGVPKSNEVFIPCASVARGDGWARQGDARRGAPSSGLFDLYSQHDFMRLGYRGLCWRTEEVGPRGHSTLQRKLSDKAFCYGRSVPERVARRDDSQASSWPSWIEALCRRTRDEPTDSCGMYKNSSVDLRDLAYFIVGARA